MELKYLILKRGTIYDLLFQGRNKDYGAYYNRKVYPEHIKKSMLLLILFFIALYTSFWIYDRYFALHQVFIKKTDPNPIIFDVYFPPKKIEPIGTPPSPPLKLESTIVNTIPQIVDQVTEPDKINNTEDILNSDKKIDNVLIETDNKPSISIGFTNNPAPAIPNTEKNNENTIVDFAEVMPEFPGGEQALIDYLGNMIRYPRFATESGIEGTVNIEFVVMEDGSISQVKLLKGLEPSCNEEAIRVIKKMPKWIPGKQAGIPVKVYYTIPITFSLTDK